MTRSKNIEMTRILEHCDERAWSIVIKGDKEHCDDMRRELFDDRVMEHCADRDHGTFW